MTKILQYCKFLRILNTVSKGSFSELNFNRHISISCRCHSANDDFLGIEEYAERTRDNKHKYDKQTIGNYDKQTEEKRQQYDYNSDFTKSNLDPGGYSKLYPERNQNRPSSINEGSQRKRLKKSNIEKSVENSYDNDNFRNESTIYGSDFIDDQYFNVKSRAEVANKDSGAISSVELNQNRTKSRRDLDFIDKQYFGNSEKKKHNSLETDYEPKQYDKKDMDYIDDQYFGQQDKTQSGGQSDSKNENKPKSKSAYDTAMEIRKKLKLEIKNLGSGDKEKETNKVKSRFDGPVDSKGFRILKYQTQDLTKEPEGIVVDILKKNIIYNEGDIIAINKPYGLPSHGGPGVKFSVGGLLHQLAESLNDRDNSLQTLHLIHRLDKETTGVMLLAKRAAVAEELREYFVKRKVVKKYWVITKGIPDPLEGVIKIPITEGSLPNGIHRMILKPEYNKKYWEVMKKRNVEEAQDAITQYKVFKHHQSAALIECQPISGIKHQIRCHLGFGLNTPILGDHKYSHFSKLAPQRLPPDMLTSLGIRASKVRHVPMHLHAKSIVIPEFQNGQNLMVSAKLPKHFLINLRRLKLN